jgi:hypothetical protein
MPVAEPALRPPWVDRRLQESPRRAGRKIHLDFHNTEAVGEVGQDFDADDFAARLDAGRVDSIVLFAKDMHGFFYYPSDRGPVHPGLGRDLLGEQIAACRRSGVRVHAYYCVAWDHRRAFRHPEWLVLKRDGTTYLPGFDEVPGWTALCLSAPDFVGEVLADTREILERYDVDGIWYDVPLPRGGECFCHRCVDAIRGSGGDPGDVPTQRAHKQELLAGFMSATHDLVHSIRPDVEIDHNNQTRIGLAPRAAHVSNIDVEALPTGGWGYQYFPIGVRYARTHGRPVTGLTGRFAGTWGDFGGLKHPRQLRVEIAAIVAQGAQCSVGDQPGPGCRLDPAVYRTIGAAYDWVERLEPYLERAAPVVEAAIVVDGLPLADPGAVSDVLGDDEDGALADSVAGTARLLRDARVQFDVVDGAAEDLDRYRLLVLPDGLAVSDELAARLAGFAERGGSVVAQAGTVAARGASRPWAGSLPIELAGTSPFSVPYLLPGDALGGLERFEYALYGGAERWRLMDANGSAKVLAALGEPAFERAAAHFTSHAQSPFAHATEHVAVVTAGRIGAIAFPLGTAYRRTGYWPYGVVLRAVLDAVLPQRLLRSDAPSCAEISLTQQRHGAEARWIVHVVNTATDVRWGTHLESFDQDVPLHDVEVVVTVPGGVRTARLAESGAELDVVQTADGARVRIPRVSVAELVVLG